MGAQDNFAAAAAAFMGISNLLGSVSIRDGPVLHTIRTRCETHHPNPCKGR